MSNVNTKKKNVEEVTNKTPNSLMKKTKIQLVDIILRKDVVECNLRSDIKRICDSLYKLTTEKEILEKRFEALKNDYREVCDEHFYNRQELKDKIERYKALFYIFLAISIILMTFIIV